MVVTLALLITLALTLSLLPAITLNLTLTLTLTLTPTLTLTMGSCAMMTKLVECPVVDSIPRRSEVLYTGHMYLGWLRLGLGVRS